MKVAPKNMHANIDDKPKISANPMHIEMPAREIIRLLSLPLLFLAEYAKIIPIAIPKTIAPKISIAGFTSAE